MTVALVLYSRKECRLCDAMKEVIRQAARRRPLTVAEIDVDSSPDLQASYGGEVPVLFINGRKAFKYRVSARDLEQRLKREAP